MNHYCTYFDRGFLAQGVALARSLAAHDPTAVVWVLALDDETARALCELKLSALRIVPLTELEAADPALAAAKPTRTRVEYYFTLSPLLAATLAADAAGDRPTGLSRCRFVFLLQSATDLG